MRRTLMRLASSSFQLGRASDIHIPAADLKSLVSRSDSAPESAEPGQYVTSICQKHNIFFTSHMRGIKGYRQKQGPCQIFVQYSQQHCFPWRAMRYLDKHEHAFTKSILGFFIKKKKEPLWVHCSASGGTAFPNKKATRKLDHAMRDALAAAGYDRIGQRVLAKGESSAVADLYGSLSLNSTDAMAVCRMEYASLLEEVKKIVAAAELHLRRDKNGHSINLGYTPNNRFPTRGRY